MTSTIDPKPGEIWVAKASVRLPVLRAAEQLESVAPMSTTMRSDLTRLTAGLDTPEARPCIIIDVKKRNSTVLIICTTTLQEASDLERVNGHMRHFIEPFGETAGAIIKPTTTWPKSLHVPTYILARPLKVKFSQLSDKYLYGGLPFAVDVPTLERLVELTVEKMRAYEALSREKLQANHGEWDVRTVTASLRSALTRNTGRQAAAPRGASPQEFGRFSASGTVSRWQKQAVRVR